MVGGESKAVYPDQGVQEQHTETTDLRLVGGLLRTTELTSELSRHPRPLQATGNRQQAIEVE